LKFSVKTQESPLGALLAARTGLMVTLDMAQIVA
jgi:hypothetical protein